MVVTQDVDLPDFLTLTVPEINLSTSTLIAAGPYVGIACEGINNEFMLCRQENNDPRPCVALGKLVTECSLNVLRNIKNECLREFNQYANCVDKSSGNYKTWFCRKTQAVFARCMNEKLCLQQPHWGYFTRARVHKAGCTKQPPPPTCPCQPAVPDPTPALPDCKTRQPARFTSRLYHMTE